MAKRTPLVHLTLFTAIHATGLRQRDIAAEAGIAETRLSHVVRLRAIATEEERRSLARVLKTTQAALFPEFAKRSEVAAS